VLALCWRRADDVPLLGVPKSIHCHRCDRLPRRRPLHAYRTDQDPCSTDVPRRPPAFRGSDAFHRRDHGHSRGSLLQASRAGLSLTPPTRFPLVGERCFFGHCKRPRGLTLVGFERADAFVSPLGMPCLGLTTQARQRGSTDAACRGC